MGDPMSSWFLIATGVYGLVALLWFIEAGRGRGQSLVPQRGLEFALLFHGALLCCWLLRADDWGGRRLFLGLAGLSLGIALRALIGRERTQERATLIAQGLALVTGLALAASIFGQEIALHEQAPWLLIVHVFFALAGVIAFTTAGVTAALYLRQATLLKRKQLDKLSTLPSLGRLDQLGFRAMLIGFPLYSAGLILGSAQALSSGLIKASDLIAISSWVIYGGLLQARLTAGWRGRRAAWLTLLAQGGLLVVLLAYLWR